MGKGKRMLLPQPIEDEALKLLESSGFEIVLSTDAKPETIFPLMKGVQGIILRTGIKMTRELMRNADDLWGISRTGAGGEREGGEDPFCIRYKNIPRDLNRKTLGLVGLGRIGSELARICHQALGMVIL